MDENTKQSPCQELVQSFERRALLFPGQGAQYVGMGKGLAESFGRARQIFSEADQLLDFPLSKICFDGPSEELSRTEIAQPAILTHSWAICELLKEHTCGQEVLAGIGAAAGLSLGEYSALAFAGVLSWQDALELVRKRGQLMQAACDAHPSTMASILGLDDQSVKEVCRQASSKGVCVAANFNAPSQVVIAGEQEALRYACELAQAAGAKRCLELQVAGAFHSPLMEPAQEGLRLEIEKIDFKDPQIPVVANANAQTISTGEEAQKLLIKQLSAPVLWAQSMTKLVEEGYDCFIEVGPGKVLTGLIQRIAKGQQRVNLGEKQDLEAFFGL